MPDLASTSHASQTTLGRCHKPEGWYHGYIGYLLLLVVTVLVYLPAMRCGYIWDDDYYVTANDTLRDVDGLVRIWTQPGAVPQYYPLVHSVFWVQYQLFELNPVSYHAVNLLCHVLVSLLWWRVLKRLNVPGSYLAALIFAVHPIQVESVVWVTELKNVLSGVFYLLTAMCYLRFAGVAEDGITDNIRPTRWGWYGLAVLCFVAALLSKTVVCTLPAAMVLVMWWKRRRFPWHDLAMLIPLFVLGAVMGLHTAMMEKNHVGAEGADWAFGFADRLLIAGRVLWFYACKIIWPAKLVFFYDYWQIDPRQFWQWLMPIGVLLVIYALLRNRRVWTGKPLVAVLFFAGTLFPALGFINVFPMRFSFVADHFQYLAGMGIIALVSGVYWHGLRDIPKVRMVIAMLIVTILGVRATNYIPVYSNQQTLWQHVIANNAAPWMALNNLGVIHRDQGELNQAEICFKQAIVHRPTEYSSYNNLGLVYRDKEQYDRAFAVLEHGLPFDTRGVTLYASMARVREMQGRPLDAIALLDIATQKKPGRADLWLNMGILQIQQQLWDDARKSLQQAVNRDPSNTKAWRALARTSTSPDAYRQMIDIYKKALAFHPDDASLHGELAVIAAMAGDDELAIEHWGIALKLEPGNRQYTLNLGKMYYKRRQWKQAIEFLTKLTGGGLYDPKSRLFPMLAVCLLNDPDATPTNWQLARRYMLEFKVRNQQNKSELSMEDRQLLATACEAAGDYAGAMSELRELIDLLTSSPKPDQSLLDALKTQFLRCQKAFESQQDAIGTSR